MYLYIYAWFSILYFSSLLYIGITLTGTRLKKRRSAAVVQEKIMASIRDFNVASLCLVF